MLKLLRRRRTTAKVEALIRASSLFDREFYLGQTRDASAARDPVRHYVLTGEALGLRPLPLFDPGWYASEHPDVARSARSLFGHYVEHGEREGRSPHPLFDPDYYRAQVGQPLDRPLLHFLNSRGPALRSPHPAFDLGRFQRAFGEALGADENPLAHFLTHAACETLLSDIFDGRFYADQLGERYAWPRHGVTEFLKRATRERVAPHPDFDLDLFLIALDAVEARKARSHVLQVFARNAGERRKAPRAMSALLPIRGRQLEPSSADGYPTRRLHPPEGSAPPRPVSDTRRPPKQNAIPARLAAAKRDIDNRLRLDHAPPPAEAVPGRPTLSILMPVYRPPLLYLDRAIRSVLQQSAPNWQLCIVDDGSGDAALESLLARYAASDARIRVASAAHNGGISRATNAALEMASGSYVALLDNDDMLTVDAVQTVTDALVERPEIDLVYSDECTIDADDRAVQLFSKPDWSPVLLLACMYTSHLSVYRKALVERVGGFRPAFDFSQDYDLALRVAETRPVVHHLGAYLYGWRMIPGSAAQGDKPQARLTNVAALQDALERRGYPGVALGLPATNVASRHSALEEPRVSIIVPSDNLQNIRDTVDSLFEHTRYTNFEVVIVTRSRIADDVERAYAGAPFSERVTCVRYDKPFNFSDKCNAGAGRATGAYLVFFNDDVRVISSGWIKALVDYAILETVGAVAPKLLYEDGSIQHAGMVTGTRRLVGTAFHTFPAQTGEHFGMAQYPREVSLLCGACIMVRADVFHDCGGFDAVNTPINHSDVDLCFRIRDRGLACVYVPTVSLRHIGHLSIGASEAAHKDKPLKRDKADIFLLKRWPRHVARDPYFPPGMRDLLYRDSQEIFEVFPGSTSDVPRGRGDVLLVSHDLTNSGAPKIVLDLARILRAAGYYVCVLAPDDGPMRARLTAIGIDVIVDAETLNGNQNVFDLARNFDLIIANTIVCWKLVRQMGGVVPVCWYVHESDYIDELAARDPAFLDAFRHPAAIWAGSGKSARKLAAYGIGDVTVVPYGIEPPAAAPVRAPDPGGPLRVSLFGSVEPRKGQDLAVRGLMAMSAGERRGFRLTLFGRILHTVFAEEVREFADGDDAIVWGGELSPEDYLRELAAADIVIVPSRDDTLPLVTLDALAQAKILLVSSTTGTSEWLEDRRSAYILHDNTPDEIARALLGIAADRSAWPAVQAEAKRCFETHFSWSSFDERLRALVDAHLPASPADREIGGDAPARGRNP